MVRAAYMAAVGAVCAVGRGVCGENVPHMRAAEMDSYDMPSLSTSDEEEEEEDDEDGERVLPRVALVLPQDGGLNTSSTSSSASSSSMAQFTAALRVYLSPWPVYEMTLPDKASDSSARPPLSQRWQPAAATCRWHRRGGVLLLLHGGAELAGGAGMHDCAEVAIACGQGGVSWVTAHTRSDHGMNRGSGRGERRRAALYFAVLSEVEVVGSADLLRHRWIPFSRPWRGAAADAAAGRRRFEAAAEEEETWAQLVDALCGGAPSVRRGSVGSSPRAVGQQGGGGGREMPLCVAAVPTMLRQSVLLWCHLTRQQDGGRTRWVRLSEFVKQVGLNCTRVAHPVSLSDLRIYTH